MGTAVKLENMTPKQRILEIE